MKNIYIWRKPEEEHISIFYSLIEEGFGRPFRLGSLAWWSRAPALGPGCLGSMSALPLSSRGAFLDFCIT